jgi:hypothetical protein
LTYSTVKDGKSDAADAATGGFAYGVQYDCTTPTPEGMNLFSGGNAKERHSLKNFVVSGNVVRPYSSDGKNRIPSTGIRVCGAEGSQIINNVVFDSGNHRGIVVASTKQVQSSVVCRDNYNIDNTRAAARDDKGVAYPDAPLEMLGLRLARQVDAAGPAKDHAFAGSVGDFAVTSEFLYLYTGDGKTHQWKRVGLSDY